MIKKFLAVVFTTISVVIYAQRNSSSPYSFFGIGEDVSRTTVEQASMGGIGVALKDYSHLNFTNPAANADLRVATYALGGNLFLLKIATNDASDSGSTTSLRYIALGFPVGDKAGFSAGLQPLSNVGYALSNSVLDTEGNITEVSRFTGTGGTTRLYGGFGINVIEGLALGFEAAFVFGTIENDLANQLADVSLLTKYERNTKVRGGQFKLGAQYKRELKNDLQLNVGATLQLQNNLSVTGNESLYTFSFDANGNELPRDVLYDREVDGSLTNPLKSIIGVGIGKDNKWYVGVDSEFQNAFNNTGNVVQGSTYKFESSRRTSIGGYYIPKINSISSYWQTVTYRAGVRFEKVGLLVDGTNTGNNFESINDFGINIGFGLPLPRQLSSLNFGFEYGQKGTIDNNLIKEEYFNIRLSLSLNSLNWFKKREID
ncbi:hypothetical protein [Tenacibaculum sp. M341]|uniref:hypothetical protein n=1 Tax=Tenacibaculum sp. M341 TaxID=2530339 RepID=UPI001053A81E|nr:hypothetical protein [Tenacibaculum sp. M341]TCI91435.1 hypothetical protein EYW44_10810 [Tenacibaculum sp. M341]